MRNFFGTKNFGYGTVLTPPSPATSGTAMTLTSGHGARFPDPAVVGVYPVVLWPDAVDALDSNAEVVFVTARSTDTLTIVRAQESTTGKTVIAGFQIQMGLTAQVFEDIYSALQSGYIEDRYLTTLARVNSTQFTTTGNQTTLYAKGRLIRFNGTTSYGVVSTSSFSVGVTTVTITNGAVPNPLTRVELAIHPLGQTAFDLVYLDSIAEKTSANGVSIDSVILKDGYGVLVNQGSDPVAAGVTKNYIYSKQEGGINKLFSVYTDGVDQFIQRVTGQTRQSSERAILGALTTGTNKCPVIIVGSGIGKITKVYAYAKIVPTGADLIFDINKNGTSIWATTTANRLKIVDGASAGSQTSFDTTTVAESDIITIDVDNIGSSVPGSNITILIFMEA